MEGKENKHLDAKLLQSIENKFNFNSCLWINVSNHRADVSGIYDACFDPKYAFLLSADSPALRWSDEGWFSADPDFIEPRVKLFSYTYRFSWEIRSHQSWEFDFHQLISRLFVCQFGFPIDCRFPLLLWIKTNVGRQIFWGGDGKNFPSPLIDPALIFSAHFH